MVASRAPQVRRASRRGSALLGILHRQALQSRFSRLIQDAEPRSAAAPRRVRRDGRRPASRCAAYESPSIAWANVRTPRARVARSSRGPSVVIVRPVFFCVATRTSRRRARARRAFERLVVVLGEPDAHIAAVEDLRFGGDRPRHWPPNSVGRRRLERGRCLGVEPEHGQLEQPPRADIAGHAQHASP